MDVGSTVDVEQAFGRVERELGPVEMLVLNAGVYVVETLEETMFESWRRTMQVNLDGVFLCAWRALPSMRQRRHGRVVAIGSSAGKTGGKRPGAAYAASKAGVMTLAKALAFEYAADRVTVNAIAPALIENRDDRGTFRSLGTHSGRAPGATAGRCGPGGVSLLDARRLHHRRGRRCQRWLPH
jgi:NAD(P)-dependent dehydrogenase (short-subunit alcohol dehydrogenase family)